MTSAPAMTGAEADRYLNEAQQLVKNITSGRWIAGGLQAGGGMAALDDRARPVDQLNAAGLGWFAPQVQPLQDAYDRMAGSASAVQSFTDAWRRASDAVRAVSERLAGCAPTETAKWCDVAGDKYRARAAEIATALAGVAALCEAKSAAAVAMAEVVADTRKRIGELLAGLVRDLISSVGQARAVQGGLTVQIVADGSRMIDSYAAPIAALEQNLRDSVHNLIQLPGSDGRANQFITDQQAVDSAGWFGQVYQILIDILTNEKGGGRILEPSSPGTVPQRAGPRTTPRPNPQTQNNSSGTVPTSVPPIPPILLTGRNVAQNRVGWWYPQVVDRRTMRMIEYPGDGLVKVPLEQRVPPLTGMDKAAYIREFYRRGHQLAPGATWDGVDLHHIRPREYGGTNDFDNLVPVDRAAHRELFNRWWADY
ncbi:hypothetical protein JOF56_008372 [Kibdelosporangium banguiense]|uniref:HNH endonuclease n=1 Tax=Kibdelosporangium banguiense TaxID=1365924 RepID=A0ABS4TUB4_9PSEU|nr:HNH endonuclease signature motif containing protein [Kibdelosporangium banguiense]MBP2327987.1 hypothetical protein [Kibdelosporangium banguiense]